MPDKVRVEVREIQMAADDDDLPARYLLYAVAVIVEVAVVATCTFFVFVRWLRESCEWRLRRRSPSGPDGRELFRFHSESGVPGSIWMISA
jgi:hypothetical protein